MRCGEEGQGGNEAKGQAPGLGHKGGNGLLPRIQVRAQFGSKG